MRIEEFDPEICINECCKSCSVVNKYDSARYHLVIKFLIHASCHPCEKFGICNKCCKECQERIVHDADCYVDYNPMTHIHTPTYTTSMRIGTL